MERFKHILVHIDSTADSEGAIDRAVELARHNGASLTLATVVPEPPWYVRAVWSDSGRVRGMVEHDSHATLEAAADLCRAQGVETDVRVLHGSRAVELVRQVLREGHDLVMLAASGSRDASGRFFSAADMRVLRKCPCPVWMLRPGARQRLHRILAAVDVSRDEPANDAVNRQVLDLADDLARADGAELHVVHVWSLYLESFVHNHLSDEEYQKTLLEARDEASARLNAVVAMNLPHLPPQRVHLVKGVPAWCVCELAAQHQVDLIVMGTISVAGVPGLLMGSTAEVILNRADCGVLALKPEGFLSPVTV